MVKLDLTAIISLFQSFSNVLKHIRIENVAALPVHNTKSDKS
jgi:hypothetical protein